MARKIPAATLMEGMAKATWIRTTAKTTARVKLELAMDDQLQSERPQDGQ